MSGENRTLRFVMLLADSDRWPDAYREEADACGCDSYGTHAQHQMEAAMEAAAKRFMDEHPGVLLCPV
jgi:hypothetical protein